MGETKVSPILIIIGERNAATYRTETWAGNGYSL